MPVPSATAANKLLDSGVPAATHAGLLTALLSTEASGGSYARQALTWASASSYQKKPSGQVQWTLPNNTTPIICVSLHDALTTGNEIYYMGIGSTLRGFGSALASTDVITSYGHGLSTDDCVIVYAALGESALPTGLSATTPYYVLASGLTTDVFKLSTSKGGSAVDITANGELAWFKTVPQTPNGSGTDTLTIAASSFVFDGTAL